LESAPLFAVGRRIWLCGVVPALLKNYAIKTEWSQVFAVKCVSLVPSHHFKLAPVQAGSQTMALQVVLALLNFTMCLCGSAWHTKLAPLHWVWSEGARVWRCNRVFAALENHAPLTNRPPSVGFQYGVRAPENGVATGVRCADFYAPRQTI